MTNLENKFVAALNKQLKRRFRTTEHFSFRFEQRQINRDDLKTWMNELRSHKLNKLPGHNGEILFIGSDLTIVMSPSCELITIYRQGEEA